MEQKLNDRNEKSRSRCWNTESGKGGNNAAHSFSRLQYIKVWRLMQ